MDAYTTTLTDTTPGPLTIGKLKAAIERVSALGPEPFRAYMEKHGFRPEDGCYMVIPKRLVKDEPTFGFPWYVHVSDVVDIPVVVRDPLHQLKQEMAAAMRRFEGQG